MNDKDKIAAQKAIIQELQKEQAEIQAARDKIVRNLPPECRQEYDRMRKIWGET